MTFSMDILEEDFFDCCSDFRRKIKDFYVEFSNINQSIEKKLGQNYEWGMNRVTSQTLYCLSDKLTVLIYVLDLFKEKEVCKLSKANRFLDELLQSYYHYLKVSLVLSRAIQRNSRFSLQVDLSRNYEQLIEKQLKLVGDYYESDEDE